MVAWLKMTVLDYQKAIPLWCYPPSHYAGSGAFLASRVALAVHTCLNASAVRTGALTVTFLSCVCVVHILCCNSTKVVHEIESHS